MVIISRGYWAMKIIVPHSIIRLNIKTACIHWTKCTKKKIIILCVFRWFSLRICQFQFILSDDAGSILNYYLGTTELFIKRKVVWNTTATSTCMGVFRVSINYRYKMSPLLIRKLIKKEAVNCSETSQAIELPSCNTYFCIDNKVNSWQLSQWPEVWKCIRSAGPKMTRLTGKLVTDFDWLRQNKSQPIMIELMSSFRARVGGNAITGSRGLLAWHNNKTDPITGKN